MSPASRWRRSQRAATIRSCDRPASPEARPGHSLAGAGKAVLGLQGGWGGWKKMRDLPPAPPPSSTFPEHFLSGRSVPAIASAGLKSLKVGGEVQLLCFLLVKAAAAAASSEETLPEASLLLPSPAGARAPPAPWSAQVWQWSNGCSARGRARLAAPAPPRRRPRPGPAARRCPPGLRQPPPGRARPAPLARSPPPDAGGRGVPEPGLSAPGPDRRRAALRWRGGCAGARSREAGARACGWIQRADGSERDPLITLELLLIPRARATFCLFLLTCQLVCHRHPDPPQSVLRGNGMTVNSPQCLFCSQK